MKPKNPFPRDYQRQRLYNWEASIGLFYNSNSEFQTIQDCQLMVKDVWSLVVGSSYIPSLEYCEDRNTGSCVHMEARKSHIIMNGATTKPEQLLHEVTHAALWYYTHFQYAPHGKEFVGLYIQFLHEVLNMDRDELLMSAKQYGVSVQPVLSLLDFKMRNY